MAPRIHDVQSLLISASIHRSSYNPVEPPTKTNLLDISRRERDRLEIYGDALLRERVVSFLFHQFPSRSAGFISTIQSAMLSNLTFTNILRKADGYSSPRGFPVDKTIADIFETMAALSYKQCPEDFEVWFRDTFVPLLNDAASLWDLADDANYNEYTDLSDTSREGIRAQHGPKKNWVESCMEVAALPTGRRPPRFVRATEIPKKRRWDVGPDEREGQPARKRHWAEAMEAAGNDVQSARSRWDVGPDERAEQPARKRRWAEAMEAAGNDVQPPQSRYDVGANDPEEQPARKRRWAEAMAAAGNDVQPPQSRCDVGAGDPEEQPARKRRWAEAMETAGNEVQPPRTHWVEAMIKASESDATAKMNKKQDKNVHDKENCRPLSETDPPQRQLRSTPRKKLEQVHCTLPAPPPKRKSRWDVSVKAPKTSERQDSSSTPSTATTTIRKDNALHLGKASANSNSVLRPTSRQPASQTPHQSIPSAPTVSRRETTSEREPLRSINTGAAASLAFPPLDHDEPWMRAGTCTPMEISPLSSPTTPTKCLPLPCGNGPFRAADLANKLESGSSSALFTETPKVIAFHGESNSMRRRRSDSICSTSSSMAISACSSPTKFISGQETPFVQNAGYGLAGGESAVLHSLTTGSAGADKAAKTSTFWPGQTIVFNYRRPLRPIV